MAISQIIGSVSGMVAGGIMYNNSKFPKMEQRNYGQELKDTLQAQIDMAPQMYAAESEYEPKYAALQRAIARQNQEADVASIEQLGPRATQASMASDPGRAALMNTLQTQVQRELESDGRMDPALLREVQQRARANAASRGMGYGPVQAALEAMQVGSAREARRQRAQASASNLVALRTQTLGDPFQAILGRTSGQQQARVFDPESKYAQDIYDEKWNADWQSKILTKEAQLAALTGMAKAGSGYGGSSSTWGGGGGGNSSMGLGWGGGGSK